MFELKLLGSVTLSAAGKPIAGAAAQRRRLALLTLVAATPTGISRDKAIGILWPDTPGDQARRLLADSIYVLRRALAADALLTPGDNIQLNDAVVRCDVVQFRAASARADHEVAAGLYTGPFLDGFALSDAPEFEQWTDGVRADLTRRYTDALEQLARAAESAGDHGAAAAWWSRLQTTDMLNGRVALALMQALAASGDVAAALRHASVHEALLRSELGIAPPAELMALAERLRTAPPPPVRTADTEPANAAAAPEAAPRRVAAAHSGADVAPSPAAEVAPSPPHAAARRRFARPLTSAALLFVMLAGFGAFVASRAEGDETRVYVAIFENETGDAALDPLGRMAADWIARGLVAARDLQVFSPGWIGAANDPGGRAGARAAARRSGARTFVAGTYYRDGSRLRFDAQILDTRTGSLLQALAPVVVPVDSASAGLELMRQRVTATLAARMAAPSGLREITGRAQPPLFEAYRNYVEGVQLFSRYDVTQAATRLSTAWSLDTTFHLAALYDVLLSYNRGDVRRGDSIVDHLAVRRESMAAFDRALFDALQRERSDDPAGVLRAMRRVAAMAPSSQFAVGHAVAAIAANEPGEALAVLVQLDPAAGLLRDNPRYWGWRTTARHLLGDHRRELADALAARAHHSDRRALLLHEIRARAALGDVDRVLDLLQDAAAAHGMGGAPGGDIMRTAAAELRAHGHTAAAASAANRLIGWYGARNRTEPHYTLASALYEAGAFEEAAAVLASPGGAPPRGAALALHGLLAARRGESADAARIAAELAREPALQRRGAAALWRARIAAALGDQETALQLLGHAFEQGLQHGLWLHTDPDLAGLMNHPDFPRTLR